MALMFSLKGAKEYMDWQNKVERERKDKEKKKKSYTCRIAVLHCEFWYDLKCHYGLYCPHKIDL